MPKYLRPAATNVHKPHYATYTTPTLIGYAAPLSLTYPPIFPLSQTVFQAYV